MFLVFFDIYSSSLFFECFITNFRVCLAHSLQEIPTTFQKIQIVNEKTLKDFKHADTIEKAWKQLEQALFVFRRG